MFFLVGGERMAMPGHPDRFQNPPSRLNGLEQRKGSPVFQVTAFESHRLFQRRKIQCQLQRLPGVLEIGISGQLRLPVRLRRFFQFDAGRYILVCRLQIMAVFQSHRPVFLKQRTLLGIRDSGAEQERTYQ